MDVTCPKCGATNRSTSRFCARCGQALPRAETPAQTSSGDVELPWLQAVQERAVKPTERLTDQQVAGTEQPAPPAPPAPQQQPAQQTQQPAQQAAAPRQESQAPADSPQAAPVEQVPTTQPETPESPPDEPPPPWVVSILEPTATPPAHGEQTYEPEELAHIMPWAHAEPGTEQKGPGLTPLGAPSLPPWLSDITVQETLQTSKQASADKPTQANVPGDLSAFEIEDIAPFVPPELEEEATGADEASPPAKQQEQVPEWLRSLTIPPRERESAPLAVQEPAPEPPPVPSRTPTGTLEAPSLTSTGPTVEPIARNVPVRPPRPGSVETLAALIQPATQEAPRPVTGVRAHGIEAEPVAARRGVLRWLLPDGIIYLAILAALLAVIIIKPPFGDVGAPAAADVQQFYNAVEAVPASKAVLVVYDWDATRSGEMSALSRAVMHQLMSKRLRFVTVSTVPQGPGFAQQITDELATDPKAGYSYTYGSDYLILGYLPGNEAALRSLVGDFSTALPLDYKQSKSVSSYRLLQDANLRNVSDFALIIDLVSDEAEMRNWIEQVGTTTHVPIIAAVPQALEPLARPYRDIPGAGLQAVVSGTAGALQYTRQLELGGRIAAGSPDATGLNNRLHAQSIAQILVALVIVASFITMALRRIFRR